MFVKRLIYDPDDLMRFDACSFSESVYITIDVLTHLNLFFSQSTDKIVYRHKAERPHVSSGYPWSKRTSNKSS